MDAEEVLSTLGNVANNAPICTLSDPYVDPIPSPQIEMQPPSALPPNNRATTSATTKVATIPTSSTPTTVSRATGGLSRPRTLSCTLPHLANADEQLSKLLKVKPLPTTGPTKTWLKNQRRHLRVILTLMYGVEWLNGSNLKEPTLEEAKLVEPRI